MKTERNLINIASVMFALNFAILAFYSLICVTTTFRVEPDKVMLTRTGALKSQMIFQPNVAHESLYQMPFGALMLSVKATSVFYDIVSDGGVIDLSYQISIENSEAGVIDYHLDIRAK